MEMFYGQENMDPTFPILAWKLKTYHTEHKINNNDNPSLIIPRVNMRWIGILLFFKHFGFFFFVFIEPAKWATPGGDSS